MKYIPLWTICVLTFLPTPVDGTLIYMLATIIYLLEYRPFSPRRDERDCEAAFGELPAMTSDKCNSCQGYGTRGVGIFCPSVGETICLSPFDTELCSSNVDYDVQSGTRSRLFGIFSSPAIEYEGVDVSFYTYNALFSSKFFLEFSVDGGSSKYNECSIKVLSAPSSFLDYSQAVPCASCEICESSIDFKYDFSNANGTIADTPGPKVESCIPIAGIISNF